MAARLGAEVAPAPFSGQFHAAQARRLTALPESPAAALPVAPVERAPEPAPPPLPAGRELGRGRAWTSKRGW